MAVNEFGVRLDRNKYAQSLFDQKPGVCWNCGKHCDTERHEVFGGALRTKSKGYGLWVSLCGECHRTGKLSAHRSEQTAGFLKKIAQRKAMAAFNWSMDDWMERFYKNHLEDEYV